MGSEAKSRLISINCCLFSDLGSNNKTEWVFLFCMSVGRHYTRPNVTLCCIPKFKKEESYLKRQQPLQSLSNGLIHLNMITSDQGYGNQML